MILNRSSGLPVPDTSGKLVSVVTEADQSARVLSMRDCGLPKAGTWRANRLGEPRELISWSPE
jgi:hypothetical protein